MIKVIGVAACDNHTLHLHFSNGEKRVFDASPYLDKGIFTELRNIGYFKQARVAFGTVQWPHEQDFAPETLYVESLPLAESKTA